MYGSYLSTLIQDVRLAINDPTAGAQFTDDDILRWATESMRRVFRECQRISSKPIVMTCDFTIPAGSTIYQLPPSIGTLIEIGEWDSDLGRWAWTLLSPSRKGPFRPTVHLSGRRILLDKTLDTDLTLRMEYKPSGNFLAHEGKRTFTVGTLSTTQFALVEPASEATDLVAGAIDDRQNAYVGAVLRVWPTATAPAVVQERVVLSSVVDSTATGKTRLLTVDAAFDPAITQNGTAEYHYELVPCGLEGMRLCVVLAAAITFCTFAGLKDRKDSLILDYRLALRTERLDEAYGDSRKQKWQKDTFWGINQN